MSQINKLIDKADDFIGLAETIKDEYESLENKLADKENELEKYGQSITIETGLGTVKLCCNNLAIQTELEAFAEALAAKYGGRVL